jgi:hypothetical protein
VSSAVAQQASEMDAVKAANQAFFTALSARDAGAMEKVRANDPDIENIGPNSKAPDLGWEGVKKAYAGTFSMETEINISMEQPRIPARRGAGSGAAEDGVSAHSGYAPSRVLEQVLGMNR